MNAVKITDRLTVAGQPEPLAFRDIAARGYTTLVNLLPDGEEVGQPGNAAERAAAADAGLAYRFLPITGSTIREADVEAFRDLMRQAAGSVYAHCGSGTQVLVLHALAEVLDGRMKTSEVEAFGHEHGFDLSAASRWLEREAARCPKVKGFYDPRTFSIQYVITDPASKHCAIVDPVLDFDEKSGSVATTNADAMLRYVEEHGLTVEWILDTHPHADHFSAAHYLKGRTGAPTAIGINITGVQALWRNIYNWPGLKPDGSCWDRLFAAGDRFHIGTLEGRVLFSPGHTLASVTYVVGDAAFVHDTVFMPDSGTARADFPGGSAMALWASIQEILALPDETRLFTGHDYQPGGRAPKWESTVDEQKRENLHIAGKDEQSFIALRQARDRTLAMPQLILHALQVNVRGGRLPEPDSNGKRYLKFPIDAFSGVTW